jgi:hypothetical protein
MFTTEKRVFDEKSSGKIEFTCKLNKKHRLNCVFGELTNLNQHMYIHKEARVWYKKYQDHCTPGNKATLTEGQLDLIKLFVSSYQSLSLISNEYFRKLISDSVKIPSDYYFCNDFLKTVVEKLHGAIQNILQESLIVTLIPDIWKKNFIH